MVGIRAQPLYLYIKGVPEMAGRPLGSLRFTAVDGPFSGEAGCRLSVEYQPPTDEVGPRRLVDLVATITSAWPTRRVLGRVRLDNDPLGQGELLGTRASTHSWQWLLQPEEVEQIEMDRAPSANAEAVPFNLEVRAVAALGPDVIGIRGETQFHIATSDWLALLRAMGYAVPPSLRGLAGESMTSAPSWSWAEQRLREARRHLALGEDREALRTAYVVFDAISANPYKSDWFEIREPDLPADKGETIAALLQAHAQILNKLGRHPSWDVADGGDRQMLPMDHWEAELVVALSQLLLSAAHRWRSIKSTRELEEVGGPTSEQI
jgi:hypothetical protein